MENPTVSDLTSDSRAIVLINHTLSPGLLESNRNPKMTS